MLRYGLYALHSGPSDSDSSRFIIVLLVAWDERLVCKTQFVSYHMLKLKAVLKLRMAFCLSWFIMFRSVRVSEIDRKLLQIMQCIDLHSESRLETSNMISQISFVYFLPVLKGSFYVRVSSVALAPSGGLTG